MLKATLSFTTPTSCPAAAFFALLRKELLQSSGDGLYYTIYLAKYKWRL
jgi:hypothetical protein